MAKHTPMIKQYLRIKSDYKDAFLFFRLGDFYELFFDDAIKAARELEITLTKRDSGQKEAIPMCGVPHHSAESYIKTLIDKGYKIAICEQMEYPKVAKGVVKREVVQLITPATIKETNMLDEQSNNYIDSLSYFEYQSYVIAYYDLFTSYNDLSTGENKVTLINDGWERVIHELYNQPVKEIVISSNLPEDLQQQLRDRLQITLSYQDEVSFHASYRPLSEKLNDEKLVQAF